MVERKMRCAVALVAAAAVSIELLVWPLHTRDVAADSDQQTIATTNALTFEIGEKTLAEQANAFVSGRSFGETPLGDVTLHDLTVQFGANRATVSGTAQMADTRVPIQVSATSDVQTGRVLVHVTEAQFGILRSPEPMRRAVEQYLQTQIDQVVAQSGAAVESVRISQGKLVIEVRPS
jgi:hypothetical protein